MASDFDPKMEQSVNITGTATATKFIPGHDGNGRLLIGARIFPTGTWDSGTLTITVRECDGTTQIAPPDNGGALTFTSDPSAGTQVIKFTTSEGPFEGVYYAFAGGGGSEDIDLAWSAIYG